MRTDRTAGVRRAAGYSGCGGWRPRQCPRYGQKREACTHASRFSLAAAALRFRDDVGGLAAEQLPQVRRYPDDRDDDELLEREDPGEEHFEQPRLRRKASRYQRRDAILGDLIRSRDEVGVPVPAVEVDETDHLRHVALPGRE